MTGRIDPEIAAAYDVPPDKLDTIDPDARDLVTRDDEPTERDVDASPCHPYDEKCGGPGGPCRSHGGTFPVEKNRREQAERDVEALADFVQKVVAESDAHWKLKQRHAAGDHSTCPPDWCDVADEPTERDVEAARQLADGLNLSGWRQESDHGCDGTEEVCAATCPIAVQVEVDPKEIVQGIAERIAQARREALAPVDQALTGMAERPPYDLNDALRRLLALRVALRGDS